MTLKKSFLLLAISFTLIVFVVIVGGSDVSSSLVRATVSNVFSAAVTQPRRTLFLMVRTYSGAANLFESRIAPSLTAYLDESTTHFTIGELGCNSNNLTDLQFMSSSRR